MNAENMVLVVQRKLKASPEYLFDAWTKPELMAQWFFAGDQMKVEGVEADLKVGGDWKLSHHHLDVNEHRSMHGKYLVIDRPNKLVFTWFPCKRDYETKVTLLFKKVSDEYTEMTLTHEGLRNEEDFNGHKEGWEAISGTLGDWLAK